LANEKRPTLFQTILSVLANQKQICVWVKP